MNIEVYQKIVDEVKSIHHTEKAEKNIFKLVVGHYENPISDILAFFLDPTEEHNLKDLCLISILECIFSSDYLKIDLSLFIQISREERTNEGNRIDIFIEGEDWTLTLENKIRASVTNPLADYYEFVNSKYLKKKNYFVILSVERLPELDSWHNIVYNDLIDKIKINLGDYFINDNIRSDAKWPILLREFLLNLSSELGVKEMNKEIIDFVSHNYTEINEIIQYRDDYFSYLANECIRIIQDENIAAVVEQQRRNWDGLQQYILMSQIAGGINQVSRLQYAITKHLR